MGATTQDLFGDAAGAQPATPGTYGAAPSGYRLPDATRLGVVKLQVTDLARSTDYYEEVLGLRTVSRDASRTVLASHGSDAPLIELHERRGAPVVAGKSRLGLYHFAILVPDRATLGRFIEHLGAIGARAGSSDHLVSEALYLRDPDHLGIEVYADRPRESWHRVGRELMMATDPLDLASIVRSAEGAPWRGMPAGTVMGHMHLHVGNLERASAFYSDGLGFDRMIWKYPGALFLGAGGYHHHLGTNTWAGESAPPAAEEEPRLLEWTIELPAAADMTAAGESLSARGFALSRDGDDVLAADPWGTTVRLRATPS
ncbi:MAG: VOC family protein [Cytophagaceae bacterium]|nr:VOC family protein [Gemmatimonadaceae bacterium]